MKRIILAEYIGNSDSNRVPIGHSTKILMEYGKLLEKDFEVKYIVPYNVLVNNLEIKQNSLSGLEHITILGSQKKFFLDRCLNNFKRFMNLKKIFSYKHPEDIIWFCNIDIFLFYYLFIHRKYCPDIICTLYQDTLKKKGLIGIFRNRIFRNVLSRLKLVIVTNENFQKNLSNRFYMPDYYYSEQFNKYQNIQKTNQTVCLGTMNASKKLEEVVKFYNKSGEKLLIAGKFDDPKRKNSLIQMAHSNICIRDQYLSYEEYLQLLAESRFTIIPYSAQVYFKRTSGVLQEAIFMKTVPIAPDILLKYNHCLGIGYYNYSDLNSIKLMDYDFKAYQNWCNNEIKNRYNFSLIAKKLLSEIKKDI